MSNYVLIINSVLLLPPSTLLTCAMMVADNMRPSDTTRMVSRFSSRVLGVRFSPRPVTPSRAQHSAHEF